MKQLGISKTYESKKEAVEGGPQKPGVYIASKLVRKQERIDGNGNVIDPVTKRIIRKND